MLFLGRYVSQKNSFMTETFGQRLRKIRKDLDLSREQLCEFAHINRRTLENWEIDRYTPNEMVQRLVLNKLTSERRVIE